MPTLTISANDPAGWQGFADTFGFVPDPMILRAGEVFLNGAGGSRALDRDPNDVWRALEDNVAGLVEFFDLLVTRDHIPLINYGDTFDRMTTATSLEDLLGEQVRKVEISYDVYNTVKKGALVGLAELEPAHLQRAAPAMLEMDALRYDWHPALDVADGDRALDATRKKLAYMTDKALLPLAHFLLGGLIFSGFAKASNTTHYIQPKRSRLLLALTAAPETANELSRNEEPAIFDAAEKRFKENKVETWRTEALPPVLPYLLAQGNPRKNVTELLAQALDFRKSKEGAAYRELANSIRAGGSKAIRTLDLAQHERRKALEFLEPYSKLDPKQSASLEIKFKGVPGFEASTTLRLSTCVRVWLNDHVPFGGIHKTLRRMWMEKEAYSDLTGTLRGVWARSKPS